MRSCGRADVSTIVVVTFSGVPMLGGIVICGNTDWILFVTKTSFTSDVTRLDLPVPSSPQTHIRTSERQMHLGNGHRSQKSVNTRGHAPSIKMPHNRMVEATWRESLLI